MAATFIEQALYDDGIEKIVAALSEPDPYTGTVSADQVKLALGEYLDIWPDSIADWQEEIFDDKDTGSSGSKSGS